VSTANILVVEDEAVVSMNLEARLPQLGYAVMGTAVDREQALRMAEERRPDLILMDINLGGHGYDGIDIANEINRRSPFGYVLKPFTIKELHATIEMALYRSEMQRKLRERDEWLAATLKSIGTAVIATDSSGHIRFVNPQAERLTGWTQAEAGGRDIDEVLQILDEKERPLAESPARRALREARSVLEDRDYTLIARDGHRLAIVDGASAIFMEPGQLAGVVVAFRDISERKRMEEELLRSNEELEQFAYAASHDLQEPLRTVISYSQLFARRLQDRLSEPEQQMLGFITDGARRMSALVAGLLDYGRVARQPNNHASFPAREAVDAAITNLQAYISETKATVLCGDLPQVTADRAQLVLVFQNLISNGIKYGNGARPQVRIGEEDTLYGKAFCVADNGIGIAPQHQQRIFGVFTRLHPARFPGTGIGLAICKRIIERHNGRIWVESQEGHGARLYFTLGIAAEPVRSVRAAV
jgi:PAS domain S-box-containing protein